MDNSKGAKEEFSKIIHGPATLRYKDAEGRQCEMNIPSGLSYAMALKKVRGNEQR